MLSPADLSQEVLKFMENHGEQLKIPSSTEILLKYLCQYLGD